MSGFEVGQQVVCVDAAPAKSWHLEQVAPPLEVGKIYTVAWCGTETLHPDFSGCISVLVDGVREPLGFGRTCVGYGGWRFRRVQRKSTDLSIEAFSTIKPGYEEPKRERVKKGVGV